jgi:hypothetical protein
MIYDSVFRDQVLALKGTGFALVEGEYDVIKTTEHVKQYLSLLRVSRQLYRETALLPYQLTTFKFGYFRYPWGKPLDVLEIFLLNRSWAQVSSLQNMEYVVKFDWFNNIFEHEYQYEKKIATIISVIDEIAFQTNLLALNAGVEAARAGEAGRGFAVVAQEVRELAQRCAGAAREIKGLISASSAQVTNGVHLVEETGGALSQIIAHVTDVRKLVTQISDAAEEQSTGISQVTRAVQEVEHITQRNAAMVEENNAEIHGLRQRVGVLSEKIERFKTREPHAQFGMGSYDRRDQQRRDVA